MFYMPFDSPHQDKLNGTSFIIYKKKYNFYITVYINDEELFNCLFNVKLKLSFNDLYKKAKESHPSIKKISVKEWYDKQQGIQMTNRKVSKKEFLPI